MATPDHTGGHERPLDATSTRRADDDTDPIEGPACTVCWLRHPEGECDRD